ncbi:MAG: HsdR family type I site-specific deoxyribonuclease [Trichlorobacter sp.]|uniref:type I restriction endonuclease subunit R n=1 Tax=Trichlorobacter sp. TaxID=2911007 RepID=UPI00256B40B2|nr:HsdR family type I site-specific deoxyribonuclease [Trichlorobacter sp.]MDK9716556.1 HsdR family type I site-specific deoxyribonuclease [Trichlorobacter sp.]
MSTVGQIEKKTQQRVVKLFREQLGYDYLGDWSDRENTRNVEPDLLRNFLKDQGHDDTLISRTLHALDKAAADQSKTLYDRNKEVYELLRYGVKVKPDVGENTVTVWLIDWKNPQANDFAIAEEVTVKGADAKAHTKRPDIVLYVNGIALGVLELKRSTVSVSEGIRQNLDNQKKLFIEHYFSTMQLIMAGNDTEGLRYGSIKTPEKYYLTWKEDSSVGAGSKPAQTKPAQTKPARTTPDETRAGLEPAPTILHTHLLQICSKERFLELIHDYIVYDAGTKKLCRHNQYFGVRAAQEHINRREGGIIWHTQGSGKSLTMVWLAKWIRENVTDSRVLIITDRTELDKQIETVFKGVNENIYRATSGNDLIAKLNAAAPPLLCSLIHKFGNDVGAGSKPAQTKPAQTRAGLEPAPTDIAQYLEEIKNSLPPDFKAKGDLYIFVDECHRTQSGELHKAMKIILPNALFIGFTGTPLLKADKQRSIEVFGKYIHTYKFNEAVKDKVVLDLRYEARDIDQSVKSQSMIDKWFEAKTKGLTDLAKAQLKARWGTLQKVLSCKERLEMIVNDILIDMNTKPRQMDGRGNAMLVSGSIYEACKFFELFSRTELKGKCAIVTSYKPSISDTKGETTGEGDTDNLRKYDIYQRMLAEWFNEAPETAVNKAEIFEEQVKKKFIDQPGEMKLLVVVDKLLTGFDAPSATYLYIDKQMRDHGLFQAICRVNRLDGDDKEYGYIVDYKDLFKSLEGAVQDYTSGALDGYDKADVAGLLEDRLKKAKENLEEARESIKALCEPVEAPQDTLSYIRFFCGGSTVGAYGHTPLQANEPKRLALYKMTATLLRAFANMASELADAGYNPAEITAIQNEVDHFDKVRNEVKLASGDYIDLKMYEPAMRHLIDTYIRAEESEKVSAFDDLSLIDLIVERGVGAVDALPRSIRKSQQATAETIENNVRKLIIDEHPINPKYYDDMSDLLKALIEQRRQDAISYQEYLAKVVSLAKQVKNPDWKTYPASLNTRAKQALYDNLDKDEVMAVAVDNAVRESMQDGWRDNTIKVKKVKNAIKVALDQHEGRTEDVLELVKKQHDY